MVQSRENLLKGISYLYSLPKWVGTNTFSLEEIKSVLSAWGNPHEQVKTIHVAGSNGKGSVCAALSTILIKAGYTVGLTISPHLSRITERIVISGVEIEPDRLDKIALELRAVCLELKIELSFFLAIIAIAFRCFSEERVDYAVIETGLGGRLDGTNVLTAPELSIITNIALEHCEILGDTAEKIAFEKAGIIKANRPVIVGEVDDRSLAVIQGIADQRGSEVFVYGRDFKTNKGSIDHLGYPAFHLSTNNGWEINLKSALAGMYQIANMSLAAFAARQLGIADLHISEGIATTTWPGRLELIRFHDKDVLIDCAHNPEGIRSLVEFLKLTDRGSFTVVFGAIQTKEWRQMIELLSPYASSWIISEPNAPNPVPITEIKDFLSSIGISRVAATAINELPNLIASADNPVLVGGSIYLVGEVRNTLVSNKINNIK